MFIWFILLAGFNVPYAAAKPEARIELKDGAGILDKSGIVFEE